MNETIKQIRELVKTKKTLVDKLKVELYKELKDIFIKYPDIDTVVVPVNNHEFNDGDSTSFSVYHEDLELLDTDGESIDNEDAVNELIDLFAKTDIDNVHECWFADEYGEIVLNRKDILK
jgi:hypothetical protein